MKNRIAMTVTVLARMGSGLLVFVLMARGLGPMTYGLVITVITYATLISFITDFGFATKTLREIAAERQHGGEILNNSLNVKIYLTSLAIMVGGIIVMLIPMPEDSRPAILMLAAAVLISAIGDLSLVGFRAMGRYTEETQLVLGTSAIHVVIIGWISFEYNDITLLAIAFLASRSLYTLFALSRSRRLFPDTRFKLKSVKKVIGIGLGAWNWAIDSGLNYLNSQLDGLVIASFFGMHIAGIYQAGGRFVFASLNMVSILANIHIPKSARDVSDPRTQLKTTLIILLEFLLFGTIFALGFLLGGPLITSLLLGPAYTAVDALWPGFACFVFIRYIAAAAGSQLAARDMPKTRMYGQLIGLLILICGFAVVLPSSGYTAAPWVMCASGFVICIFYWTALILHLIKNIGSISPPPLPRTLPKA